MATPIGNLGDCSARQREVLGRCDLVVAEDTRVARRLLSALGIAGKRISSVRAHNEKQQAKALAAKAQSGAIAYLCDAGTPGISDPGAVLVAAMHAAKVSVVPVAGPSAVTAALSASGFAVDAFTFGGFLPRAPARARRSLERLCRAGLPLVLFESPRRLAATLGLLAEVAGASCRLCLCAELTKLHESIERTTVGEAVARLGKLEAVRGEYTLVVELSSTPEPVALDAAALARALAEELPARKAARLAAKLAGGGSRELYALLARKGDATE